MWRGGCFCRAAFFYSPQNRICRKKTGEIKTGQGKEVPYVKSMCGEGSVIGISKGIIRGGKPVITSGPLKGREGLIQKIDRHKRTADIEIPLAGNQKQVTVGLEIYEKM